MNGQGSPSSSACACARSAQSAPRAYSPNGSAIAALALALCALLTTATRAQDTPAGEPVRLRIQWGGAEPARWFGRIWVDDGAVANLKLLGLAADGAGSVWIEQGQVHVGSLSARPREEIEVAVAAGDRPKLLIALSTDARQPPPPVTVALSELALRPYVLRLDARGSTLRIERIAGNSLHVAAAPEQMIFAPGEQFSFELRPQLAEMDPGTTLDIHTTLSPSRRSETIWSDEARRLDVPIDGAPTIALNVPMPKTEGVYTVRVTATRPPGFRSRFFPGGNAPLAERTFDVVVLSAEPRSAPSAQWNSVLEIDPTNPGWWERLPDWTQLRRIPGINRGHLGSIRAGTVDRPLGRFVELPPNAPGAEPHWQAYSLPLEAVDSPHLLEIEYPVDREQHFGVSIVEPNAAGQVEGLGRDGGVYVEGFGRGEATATQTYRMVFWPRTQAPLLVMTNQHASAAAHFGRIRVLKRSTPQLTSGPPAPVADERLVAAYFARPLLAETFGAGKRVHFSPEADSAPASIDDWRTFYDSATRLAEYVRYGGYNSAVVSVLSGGSSIYPSARLLPTPLHNSGRAAPDATDRDALELLLRVFDREGLALLPALELAAPIPELEALRRAADPQTSGLEWVGPDGNTWLQTHGVRDGLAPYYNLLEPRVQKAILAVVSELVERYGDHPSLAGLSIQLSTSGYGQLPPLEWGLDDATIARFERDTRIALDAAGPSRFAARRAQLTGPHVQAWRTWRAARVADFYKQLAGVLRTGRDDRRLVLTLEQSFANPQLAARVRPNLLLTSRVDALLVDSGIDREILESVPGLVVCATRYVAPAAPLPKRAIELELNEAFAAWQRKDSVNGPAALLYHPSQRHRLASFEAKSPFRVAAGAELVSHALAHGPAVRKPYVRTLLQHDPVVLVDGGEQLPLGQDDVLRDVRTIIRRLPAGAEVAEISRQPLIVRTYAEPDGVTLLVVNASPWHAEAEVTLEVPQAATMQPLVAAAEPSSASIAERRLAPGRQPWSLSLEPYAIEAVRIDTPGVRVADAHAAPSDAAKAELSARLSDLANRNLTAPHAYAVLSNPSFELLGGPGAPLGWRLPENAAVAELDAANPQEGNTCLYLRSTAAAAMESDPFPIPQTGQLAMTVHVRDPKLAPGTELRMVFEATSDQQVYRRSAVIAVAQPAGPPRNGQWQYKATWVNDLPLESSGEMRVRFELTGPGEAWLDSVKLYDLLFPLEFYKYEEAEKLQFVQLTHAAKSAFDEGRIADSARLLDRYWLRFLAEYTPLIQPAIAAERMPKLDPASAPPADQKQEPTPSIGERIKRAFPFMR